MTYYSIISALTIILCLAPGSAPGQWGTDPATNIPIATGPNDRVDPVVAADGSGGTIIAWREYRPLTGYDVFAGRVDTLGITLWQSGGVAVCTTAGNVFELRMAADGRGGALLTWREQRGATGWDIYAQRIDSNGAAVWIDGGVAVCTAAETQDQLQIVSDGNAGAIIVWRDQRTGLDRNIYAQRIDSAGAALWTADGVAVCGTGEDQNTPQAAGDGAGGVVVAWADRRSGTNFDIYAQRITDAGLAAWITDGVSISIAANDQVNPRIVGDGGGRSVIAWEDQRSGVSWDIYAQRVNGSGSLMWNPAAEAVCTAPFKQSGIDIADYGGGGAFIVWQDDRNTPNPDLYGQRLGSNGMIGWTPNGVQVCGAANQQLSPRVTGDGAGGAFFVWSDFRGGAEYDIYAQRILASGSAAWTADGIGVGTAAGSQVEQAILTAGGTNAVVVWKDGRSGGANEIYAQNMLANGTFGNVPWVTASAGPNGSISPAGVTAVPPGGSLQYTMTPNTGYHVDSVYLNGTFIGSPASYNYVGGISNATIHVVFAINVYYITATAGEHGSISQPGTTAVIHGQTQAYGITPDPGYEVKLVQVDGEEVDTTTYYIFSNITSDHSISAWFGNDSTSLTTVGARWNMVSVPSIEDDYSASTLFPTASTDAFYFAGSYQTGDTMENGLGYWIKYDSAQVVTFFGAPLTIDTIDVAEGWNMIGSISGPVPVGNIWSIPPGIVTSQFFGYTVGYTAVSAVRPCRGYWVKASEAGQLVLSTAPEAAPSSRIRIVPTDEGPPAPPAGVPVSDLPAIVTAAPSAFRLGLNYPNPFNPTTSIAFDLPAGTDVRLEVYNITGARVALLAEGFHPAGSHVATWNAGPFPSGVYFYRLLAGSFNASGRMLLVK